MGLQDQGLGPEHAFCGGHDSIPSSRVSSLLSARIRQGWDSPWPSIQCRVQRSERLEGHERQGAARRALLSALQPRSAGAWCPQDCASLLAGLKRQQEAALQGLQGQRQRTRAVLGAAFSHKLSLPFPWEPGGKENHISAFKELKIDLFNP